MQAREYVKQFNRMCYSNDKCSTCPFYKDFHNAQNCENALVHDTDKAIEIVEKWAKEHPENKNYKEKNKMQTIYNYTEQAAKEYAKEASKTVVIRSYENGNSRDDRRIATKSESEKVESAIASALIAIKNGYDEDSAKATAEFFVIHNSGEAHINTYDSVYIPINEFLQCNIAQ